jgi:hypothetical protein
MSRGKAYNIWKTKSKYISRLKKNMYYWKVQDGERVNKFGYVAKVWKKPSSWKELDQKGSHVKLYKKTASPEKRSKWEEVDHHRYIKDMRDEGKRIIDEEMNNE